MNKYLKLALFVSVLVGVCVSSAVAYSFITIEPQEESLSVLGDAPSGGVTRLWPNADTIFYPLGWSAVPVGNWWANLDDNPPDGDTTYVKKTGGRNTLQSILFQDLMDGENPPCSEDVIIDSCTIYMYCKDRAVGFPTTASRVSIIINGWTIFVLVGPVTTSYTYKSTTHYDVMGAPITVSDVNNAACKVSCTLGAAMEFRITQMYIDVSWSVPEGVSTVIAGNTIIAGNCIIG